MKNTKIGFIGTGFIGGNLSKNFKDRGFKNITLYDTGINRKNRTYISACDIVFVAVPTPTTPDGFDSSILMDVLPLVGEGKIAVIKSTVPPRVMENLHVLYSHITLMHCPEFLSEDTARKDTDKPERNIIGISNIDDVELIADAARVMRILPEAEYEKICTYTESTMVKYIGNCFFYVKNMFFNMMYDLAYEYNCDWDRLHEMILEDSRIHPVHTKPFDKKGRGAGGHCLIKDFATLANMYDEELPFDGSGHNVLRNNETKNMELLTNSDKDLDLLGGVYNIK